jgi:hypothetical protein
VTVILFDALNIERTDQILARRQVLKVLDQLPPQSRVALYWLSPPKSSARSFCRSPFVSISSFSTSTPETFSMAKCFASYSAIKTMSSLAVSVSSAVRCALRSSLGQSSTPFRCARSEILFPNTRIGSYAFPGSLLEKFPFLCRELIQDTRAEAVVLQVEANEFFFDKFDALSETTPAGRTNS